MNLKFSQHCFILQVNKKFNLSLFEKQKVPALQIGMAIPVPVLSVEEANFSKSVSRVSILSLVK